MMVIEKRFTTALQYINYDFDDKHGFFVDELTEFMESIDRLDPEKTIDMKIDFSDYLANIIISIFQSCDMVIIKYEPLILFGVVDGKRFLIKKGANLDINHSYN